MKCKHNMQFWINGSAQDLAFVAGLELEGVEVHSYGNHILAYGLSEERRTDIEKKYNFKAL
ncbi:MAG: hypothetical protein J6U28_08870 [Bacteroidales bacterium]|nr:hypothetical protein [Bacteroidales bacterium]